MPFRGFVAVDVGPRPSLVALVEALSASGADVKPVAPENLHLTLRFLGPTADGALSALGRALEEAAGPEPPFTLRLRGTGTFPPRGSARVYWVGVEGAEPLARMAARLDAALEPLGWPPERRAYEPHLTVARARSARGADAAARALASVRVDIEVRVDRLVLYESVLSRSGPIYTERLARPLGAAA